MTDYISREAAIKEFSNNGSIFVYGKQQCKAIVSRINSIPAADVRPVVRAVWHRYSPFTDTYECSNCGEQVIDQEFRTNFCPNCGAWMEES